jgi:16S rRNA processing protein RimM
MNKKILAAQVLKSHGVHGVLKVGVYLEDFPEYFNKLVDENQKPVEIITCTIFDEKHNYFLIKIKDCNRLEDTLLYIGKKWFIEDNQLEKTQENNYYYHQLIGLPVLDSQNNSVGKVYDIDNMGAGDIIIVQLNIDRLVYLPFDEYTFSLVNDDKLVITDGGLNYIFEE